MKSGVYLMIVVNNKWCLWFCLLMQIMCTCHNMFYMVVYIGVEHRERSAILTGYTVYPHRELKVPIDPMHNAQCTYMYTRISCLLFRVSKRAQKEWTPPKRQKCLMRIAQRWVNILLCSFLTPKMEARVQVSCAFCIGFTYWGALKYLYPHREFKVPIGVF